MSQRTTRTPSTPAASFLHENPDTQRLLKPCRPRSSWRFGLLLTACIAINLLNVVLGIMLFRAAGQSVSPPADRKIHVPYGDNAELWEAFHGWLVQEDGRIKPLDTFAREAVRTITGRERFEGNDPVAIVLSWILLYDTDENLAILNSRQAGAEWEQHPFILCEYPELREGLYREKRGEEARLTAEQLHGKYVEPAVLRDSKFFKKILSDSAARQAEDSKAPLTQLEQKAAAVKKRLALYDRIRAGGQEGRERVNAPGEFGLVALDQRGSTWFSLRALREFQKTPGLWDEMMQARRIANDHVYQGEPAQPMPSEQIQSVTASLRHLQKAYLSSDATAFATAASGFRGTIEQVSHKVADPAAPTTDLELWFNQANPFRKAWIVTLLAAFLLLGSLAASVRWPLVGRLFYLAGLAAFAAGLGWSCAGFYCRVAISGRPPVSNMYESVIWVGFMTGFLGLLLEFFHRRGVLALAGALVSSFGLLLADRLPLSLSPNIQPLVAVLRSNYWLTVHVLTIVSSYAAFALAWGLGNFNLGLMLFAPQRGETIKALSQLCYRAIQIGVVLLAAGTLLGGFWAAESWGRFWGWDPKEVWALIALLCYIIPLHARYVGWVKDFGLAACSVVCFASVVMAWYGVNFVLGAGLHSYGFGGGNDSWVYWGGLINIALVLHAALRYYYWQPLSEAEAN